MAQDVFSKMADEPCLLKEDGYLNAGTDLKKIVYHPSLNVIIICTKSGQIHVIDVNSGVVLHSSNLSAQNFNDVICRYISGQDRVLFCDGQAIGVRSDYNGVLLLDTILQKPVSSAKDEIKLELLLSEAIILKKSLSTVSTASIDYAINELTDKISEAQIRSKKGIKAQKWNTVCLELPLEVLRAAANSSITELLVKNQHVPELGVASAVQERLSELMGEPPNVSDRRSMASEAKRRETFTHWPHMDYKWALPDQMAQAGFYHQPNSSGDDRAMCFTCTVCLVCWERTDEPWSEHERHSPNCPFVMGEYTQNVPLSVTYATNPAIDATYRGVSVNTLGTSSVPNLLPTANKDGLISVFDVSGKVSRTHSFFVTHFDSHILEKFTQDFGVPAMWTDIDDVKDPTEKRITSLAIVGDKIPSNKSNQAVRPRATIICGLKFRCHHSNKSKTKPSTIEALNDQNKNNLSCVNIMDIDEIPSESTRNASCLYLVVYDFLYKKELVDKENDTLKENTNNNNSSGSNKDAPEVFKSLIFPYGIAAECVVDETNDLTYMKPISDYIIKQQTNNYQTLIPGESDEIFLPPSITPKHSGPRALPVEMHTETDSAQATSLIIPPPDYTFMNGPLNMSNVVADKSISDHIIGLKNSKTAKKLNYSRAVQCISVPEQYKNRTDMEISDILPTQDGSHILVILNSTFDSNGSVLLLYSLNLSDSMIKLVEEPVLVRELNPAEKAIEVNLLTQLERTLENTVKVNSVEGTAILVCADGVVRIMELATLKTLSFAKLENEKFVSAAYCNSLERLCASTSNGSLHFYALNDTDSDSTEDHEEDDLFSLNSDLPSVSAQPLDSLDTSDSTRCFYDPPELISLAELKRLYSLCHFETFKPGFCAVVPPCWSDMQQAQRQRRHPQHLQLETEQYTKTWRLQNDTTTWDEHIFEITLPSPVCIGHVDVHFTLQTGSTNPSIEVTLLRQNTNSIGHRRDVKFAVDDAVTFDALRSCDNPVISQEYLRSHNADILAGPIDVASNLDLSDQSGCLTLTSPKLFKSRNRTLLLHIKAVNSFNRDELKSNTSSKNKSRTDMDKNSGNVRKTEYMGCDCIHELSVTVYNSKHTEIPHERTQRSTMLESNVFIQSLLLTTVNCIGEETQVVALDILNWIASIRLARNRSQNGEPPTQQYELLKIIENNLENLLTQCLLLAGRSIAHKCVRLIAICSNGARNMNEFISSQFDSYVFNALLNILDSIQQIKSAGGLQWLIILIYKVAQQDHSVILASKCINLLTKIADELNKRTNPYHLLLRSRFGLYGTPLEPELFDMDVPPTAKASSSSITYASVTSGETIAHTECPTFTSKENLDPKDILTTSGDLKIKLKNLSPSKMFRGLLETEPLHFTCISASDGTRLERADAGNNLINNICPITVYSNSGTKKVDFEHLFGDIPEVGVYKHGDEKPTSNGQGSSNSSNSYENTYPIYINSDSTKKEELDKLWCLALTIDSENSTQNVHAKTRRAEEILSPNKTLPWQQLLVTPPQQVIIVERMHSGARRFVTLDFGQPILLTDIMIPTSHDLVSISIDLWLKSEEIDGLRLVVSSDIGNRDLVINDLQPPPLCRYMKITTVGRYGMSTTRCRIPIGNFYGHLIVLPEEIPPDQAQHVTVLSQADLESQLNILTMLFEDVSCRYSLSCSKLKDLLHPFLMSDSSNAAHLSAYMETIRDRSNGSIGTMENMKIVNIYQEAVTYQRQINIVRVVMTRIENALNKSRQPVKYLTLAEASTDKLRLISEGLLEVLLSIDSLSDINIEVCQKIFHGFCISQRSRVQILAATLLDRSCRKQPYWGNFLADTLATMFSSSYTENFPQDRVFVLLAYLVRKSIDRSAVLDATLRVVSQALLPMTQNRKSLLAVTVDLPLLGWLLLFLSLQLDLCKGSQQNANRWDWVTGEMAGKNSADNINSNYRKKLHKRFIQYKQQLDNLDFTHKVVQTSAQVQALSAISNHAANLTSKLEAALKHQENFFKKIKQYKVKEGKIEIETSSKQTTKRKKDCNENNSVKQSSQIIPQHIDSVHCLTVSKGLLTLLLAIDHSCSADMFLLSCKVIARLVRMSGLTLSNLMSEDQLSKLINLCIGSELPWAPHALACLLQDIVDVALAPNSESDMETDPSPASTSWGADILSDVESLCESFEIEDHLMAEQMTKSSSKSASINNHSTPLPSVYESDDSEFEDFLDDILERGRSLLRKPSKTSHSTYGDSCAMDSRLETTVELQAEVSLRRLILLSSHSLIQNINAPIIPTEVEYELTVWPSELIIPWQIQTHANTRNRNMLVTCFDNLFRTLQVQSSANIEHILQLWLTLSLNSDEKFNPNSIPFIALSPEAVNSLISAITWSPGLSLRTWCSALQALTLICNIMHGISSINSEWSESFGLYNRTGYIVNHSDFVQMFLRLLSGTGLVFSDKGLAGPSLCKALHDFTVRLHMRCDVVSPTSQAGSLLKSLLLKVIYQLVQPSGPLNARQGPLDAQCKLLQTMVYLDYTNADLSIVISILECTGILVHSYVSNSDRIKCVNIGERLSQTSHSFSGIFASVLGGETNKQDRPVSWDMLLISLLKLLVKLVQTPLPNIGNQPEAMETESAISSQTDESKAEQIHQDTVRSAPPIPCLADTVLQHHPSIIRLCQALAACKASSLSMLANISQQSTIADLGEPTTVGDAVFNLLAALARKASQKAYVMEPLLIFLSQAPQLSEPLLWFILQVLDTEESLRSFVFAGGIRILGQSLVRSSNAPNTVSHASTVSMVMQHFVGFNARSDANTAIAASSSTKKLQQACLENNLSLVNFAPYGSIRCQSGTAHPADVLIQGGTATHRRARTPQWSYHFYPEEAHTELTLQLPSAVLLREVHLQPHLSALATCPSAVALEVSADGPSRLVPACPPLPTSGMTFIRLHLPVPEVVNCIQLRLYKPRDANNIGLSQIRLLGTSAFGGNVKQQILDLSEDESHCKYSLGWLRLLHHCFTLSNDEELGKRVVASAAQVPNLLNTCCGLLLVPTHIPSLYLPNLEKVLCELSLYDRQNGLNVIRILLNSRLNGSDPINVVLNLVGGKILMNSAGSQSACELLYQVCGHQDHDTPYRVALMLEWLQRTALQAILTNSMDTCSSAYISCIASIIWTANQMKVNYNLAGMITLELFDAIYKFNILATKNIPLKCALDSLLCSLCYIKSELFPLLLQRMSVLIPNLSTDHAASISDDRKDSEGLTDDSKQIFENNSEWYGHLVISELPYLDLSNDQLETIALVSRSPTAIKQLLDSGLPKLLNSAVLQFCNMKSETASLMSKLDKVTVILKFFANVSEEKLMRDWLGSSEGSSFWLPLLQFLCKRSYNRKAIHSENFAQLEEVVVRFLSRVCLCHPNNQALLAKVLCEVIAQQTNGITGFMRRLILQLLLENERIPVSIKANETLYKNSTVLHPYLPLHPAFKQTHDRALLYLGTNVMIGDILVQYISFSTSLKTESPNKKDPGAKTESLKSWWAMTVDSDISMAAGVTAKDKRVKDAKNQVTATPQLKKKRYTSTEGSTNVDNFDGRIVKCDALPDQTLPVNLTLAQLLRMIEDQGSTIDWPCIHLTICQSKGTEEDSQRLKITSTQKPLSSALQVFSSMGGLALLAQHLPTVYPETIRTTNTEKSNADSTESDWVKVEGSDDIYEDLEEPLTCSTPKTMKSAGAIFNVPPHSLTAFGLFLRLPGYAEVLLRDMKKALCLLRLVLGVTDDGEGGDIFQTPVADSLPTLPFEVLKKLYEATPLTTDDGRLLRRISINIGVVHLLLACLGIFTHQTQSNTQKESKSKDDRCQLYWAKGTGFGTGSTQQSWNVEQALLKQRSEEEHVTVLLQVLSSYINPAGENDDELGNGTVLPPQFAQLLANSALLPALSSYLRNDSVLDMARHIPLYRAALELLRALAVSCQLVNLLLPQKSSNGPSISSLLKNMKTCVDTYASKLRSAQTHKKSLKKFNGKPTSAKYKFKTNEQLEEMERDEGLAMLMPDIQLTATLVCNVTDKLADAEHEGLKDFDPERPLSESLEERYLKVMKTLQFDTYEMIQELPEGGYKFVISHHFENNARTAGDQSSPARVKRLAQEAVTLVTSLPLSYSSSVFVRCDTDRLDIMKVLITGPAETPYANGCFELDVYFPPDYPQAPMMINLETTGHHSVRFNPNLYNDGKVCLSVLNTWHGRPEEKWNPQTSSFLQVLVSIQSLILVPEPYFNEPGYERSRGTPSGTQSSKEYNANICQATVRWAMLEQIVNPCPCFRDVINAHFYLKRDEIIEQVENWIKDLENDVAEKRVSRTNNKRSTFSSVESFKKVYQQLKEKLMKLTPPPHMDGESSTSSMEVETSKTVVSSYQNETQDIDNDIDMEKMVNDMCE